MTYSEKLKNPLWQKKRLEVFERDNFTCQYCFSQKKTLHVHHLLYDKDCEPWQYENECLITACEDCHKKESEKIKLIQNLSIRELKIKLLYRCEWSALYELVQRFNHMELFQLFSVFASEFHTNEELLKIISDLNKWAYDKYCNAIQQSEQIEQK